MRFLGPIALLVLIGLLFLAWQQHKAMVAGLPARHVCASQEEARQQAGGLAYPVLGTGSMAPYLPASRPGVDLSSVVVAYAVPDVLKGFNDVKKGDLCVYWAGWAMATVVHQAAEKDKSGWVMSGLNNKRSETWARMTPDNFRAVIKEVYVF